MQTKQRYVICLASSFVPKAAFQAIIIRHKVDEVKDALSAEIWTLPLEFDQGQSSTLHDVS